MSKTNSKIYGPSNYVGSDQFGGRAQVPKDLTDQQSNQGIEGGGRYRDAPSSELLDNPGFQTGGYIDKKGVTAANAMDPDFRYNRTPPGMFIDDQSGADIRPMTVKFVTGMGYPGDGWSGQSEDIGI